MYETYSQYIYNYLRDYIKPLLDDILSQNADTESAIHLLDTHLFELRTELLARLDSIIATGSQLLTVAAAILFAYTAFNLIQKRWFVLK